jgi:hypothetical protein
VLVRHRGEECRELGLREIERCPELDTALERGAGRQDAHDRVRVARHIAVSPTFEDECLSNNVGVGAEARVVRAEPTSEGGVDAEEVEEIATNLPRGRELRSILANDVELREVEAVSVSKELVRSLMHHRSRRFETLRRYRRREGPGRNSLKRKSMF